MKFTIATPHLNQAGFLPECLESVRRQSLDDGVEVCHVVLDGGSTDGAVALLRAWAQRWPATESYAFSFGSGPDGGQASAINRGLAGAEGEVLAYLCADDLYEPGALARVVEAFKTDPSLDVVYGDFYFLEGESGWKRRKNAGPYSLERLRAGNFLGQPSVFWRRRVWETQGPFDESLRYCMDHEYWLRLAGKTRWAYVPEVLSTCRLHPEAKTSSQIVAMWEEVAQMTGRYGLGDVFQKKAVRMRLYGAAYYAAKRFFFQWLGRLWVRKR